MAIEISGVVVEYGEVRPLDDLNLVIEAGSTAIMGPSGSGKSTLLRVIAGLQRPDAGSVTIDGAPVDPLSWKGGTDLRVAVIHQDYRLVPFLDVGDNLLLAAELRELDVASDVARTCSRGWGWRNRSSPGSPPPFPVVSSSASPSPGHS